MIRGDLGDAFIRIAQVVQDAFGAAFPKPLVHRAFELRLEFALETAHAHVRKVGEIRNVVDILIILENEILEIVAVTYDKVQKGVKLFRSMVAAEKDAQLLLLNPVKMNAVETIVQGSGQYREKINNRLLYNQLWGGAMRPSDLEEISRARFATEYLLHRGGSPAKRQTIRWHWQAAVPETCRFMGARNSVPASTVRRGRQPHSRIRLPSATYTSALWRPLHDGRVSPTDK